ncbi:hypothetical protein [Bradyrhizobium elkanii]|uniref:hypothetical protein n=2 Tax=Nitrobacteraceae TaxID=41294 RepID=UPI002714CF06|nr:hypothetical protein [Bradyrhizobium elkanii]WLB83013.1 hypothetical protein QIH83_10825 [Bradyrhizobium elkanii]
MIDPVAGSRNFAEQDQPIREELAETDGSNDIVAYEMLDPFQPEQKVVEGGADGKSSVREYIRFSLLGLLPFPVDGQRYGQLTHVEDLALQRFLLPKWGVP